MTHEDSRHAAWRAEFLSLGEETVRMMDSGSQVVPDDRIRFSRVWLKQQDDAKASEAAAKRDSREEETLALACKALRSSHIANTIAAIAAIIAVIAIVAG